MHTAPAVSYPVGRSRFGGWCTLALLAAAGLVFAAWVVQAPGWSWRQALGATLLLACAAAAWRGWRLGAIGSLSWDGEAWTWRGADGEQAGRLEKVLDLQERMLVRWHLETGRAEWFWVERDGAPAHWEALRRAVYSPARTEAPQKAEPPAAGP
jgi:toxin CptA